MIVKLESITERITDYVASGSFASLKENVKIYKTPNYAILVKTADFANNFKKDLTYTDKQGYDYLKNSNLFGGELILSNIGSIGKVFIVPKLDMPMTLASNSIMVKPDKNHLAKWLYYYFLSNYGHEQLLSITSGTSMPKFNKTSLKALEIKDKSLEEQLNQVKSLDCILSVIAKERVELSLLDELIKSRFNEMFSKIIYSGDRETNFGSICDGIIGLTYKPDNISDEGTIVLRSGNIQNNNLQIIDDVVRVSNINIPDEKMVRDLDILMCARNGSARLVGKTCIIRNPTEQMTFGAFMTIIRTKYPYILHHYMNSDFFRIQLKSTQTASVNQITNGMLKEYSVFSPTDAEEKQFRSFVEQIDKLKFNVQKRIDYYQELLNKKMDEYFN